MTRRIVASALLAVVTLCGGLLPGVVPMAAAASCSAWTSESNPPPTIRVYRHVSGNVDTVDFKTYAKNVLSREWISSWTTESLRAGALAVRNYAWYQVLHWRGGVNADGQCFDLRDDTWDQVYDPSRPTYSTAATAVDDTWSWRVYKSGRIFPTYYNAGDIGEACGANANGWKAYQWGTQGCGLAGLTASQIIATYYFPGVTVSGAPGSSAPPSPSAKPTPSPSATPTPSPTATPTPSPTPSPSATLSGSPASSPSPMATPTVTLTPTPSPTVAPLPTPAPTATPRQTPVPTPLPKPPAGQQLPGGGQVTVSHASAPPPPPPANPTPVVADQVPAGRTAEPPHATVGASGPLEWADPWSAGETTFGAQASGRVATSSAELAALDATLARGAHSWQLGTDPRLTTFQARLGPTLELLARALAARMAPAEFLAAILRRF